jgi:hypothetical protein
VSPCTANGVATAKFKFFSFISSGDELILFALVMQIPFDSGYYCYNLLLDDVSSDPFNPVHIWFFHSS